MLLLVPYSSIESVLAVESGSSVSSVEAGESGKAALTIRATTAAFPTSSSPIKEGKGALKEPPAADRAGRGAATSFARRSSGFCGSSGKSFSRNCRYGNWGCYTSFFRETQKSATKAATKVRAPTTSIAGATTSFRWNPQNVSLD